MRGKVEWVGDYSTEFGWKNVTVEELGKLAAGEVGEMIHDSALRMVKSSWGAEAQERSKPDACAAEVVGQ